MWYGCWISYTCPVQAWFALSVCMTLLLTWRSLDFNDLENKGGMLSLWSYKILILLHPVLGLGRSGEIATRLWNNSLLLLSSVTRLLIILRLLLVWRFPTGYLIKVEICVARSMTSGVLLFLLMRLVGWERMPHPSNVMLPQLTIFYALESRAQHDSATMLLAVLPYF